jgi:N-acetyl-anhydromuramoyl-L-alanine amidase
LRDLCLALRHTCPITFVVGHEHIAPGRKQDPGQGFDWSALEKSVAWSPQAFPFLLGEI